MAQDHENGSSSNIISLESRRNPDAVQADPAAVSAKGPIEGWKPWFAFMALFSVGALILGVFVFEHFSRPGPSQEELSQLSQAFTEAVKKTLSEKKRGSRLKAMEVLSQKVEGRDRVKFEYRLSFEEPQENGEVISNDLKQIAVLRKDGFTWKFAEVLPTSQKMLFETGMAVATLQGDQAK